MNRSFLPSGLLSARRHLRRLLRWTLIPLLLLAALLWLGSGGQRWLGGSAHAQAPGAAPFVLNDFVVSDPGVNAILRFTSSGMPDPAPAIPPGFPAATYEGGSSPAIAWGPDGLFYRNSLSGGGIQSFDVTTNTTTLFVSGKFLNAFRGMVFGPDGNLYVADFLTAASIFVVDRFCGPLNGAVCAPGTPFPSGQPSPGPDPAFYSSTANATNIEDVVFGPDGNLYASNGGILRYCGPANSSCAPGIPLGLSGAPGDDIFVPSSSLGGANSVDLAFGPDGNLYLPVNVPSQSFLGAVLRFCGGSANGSTCPAGAPDPAAGQTGATFIPAGVVPGTYSFSYLDFDPSGNLDITGFVFPVGGEIFRFFGPTCSPAPSCEGQPDGLTPGSATLVAPGTGGLSDPTFIKFPRLPSSLPPLPLPTLLVDDLAANKVLRYDLASGNPLPAPGQSGADFIPAGSGGLSGPAGMVIGPNGNLYVASTGTNSILRFDGVTGAPTPGPGQSGADFIPSGYQGLSFPQGIAFDFSGKNLYVSSDNGNSVLRFDATTGLANPAPGRTGAEFVAAGSGGLIAPIGLAFGPSDQNLYVVNFGFPPGGTIAPGSVLRYDGQTGQFIDAFVKGLSQPFAIDFGPDGNLYVDEGVFVGTSPPVLLTKVDRFDSRTGKPLPASGQMGDDFVPDVGPFAPAGFTFASDGQLYVNALTPGSPTGQILRFDGVNGNLLGPFVSSGLDQPNFLIPGGVSVPFVSGKVFHDSATPGNEVSGAQVQAEQELFPGQFICPIGLLSTVPCPSTNTDLTGNYTLGNLGPGFFLITAWPTSALPGFFPNSVTVTVPATFGPPITAPNIVLVPPAPIPAGTTVSPATQVSVSGGSVPVVLWNQSFSISTQACSGGTGLFTITDATGHKLVPGPGMPGTMTEGPPGTYTGFAGPLNPFKGATTASITITCSPGPPQTTTFTLYIDPSGTVVDDVTNAPIPGATVTLFRSDTAKGTFTMVPAGSAFMSLSNRNNPDMTNAAGQYGWDVAPGFYYLQASAPGYTCDPSNPPHGFTCVNGSVQSGVFAIPPAVTDLTLPLHALSTVHATALVYTGATQGDFNDPATLAATLMDTTVMPNAPVVGAPLTLTLGALSCSATTDATGRGACSVTPDQTAGPYPVSATFAGNAQFAASSASASFTVLTEEDSLAITSSPTLALGTGMVAAQLLEDGTTPIAGRTVTFSAGGLTATGITDSSGTASAALALPTGKFTLIASFAGDGNYKPSAAAGQTLFVYQPTTFVIWGGNPPIPPGQPANIHIGGDCNFWGRNWQKQVKGGSFSAAPIFYGFANQVGGATWTDSPDKNPPPPPTVASYISVSVATQAGRVGNEGTTGNIAELVVVQVINPGAYQPNPNHPAGGVIVAVVH